MITEKEARDLAQAYIDRTLMKPTREWSARANAMVEQTPEPIRTCWVRPISTGFAVTYNTIPSSIAGHRPLYVSADGAVVRKAMLREMWDADPTACPHMLPDKQAFIDVEEEGIRTGNPWILRSLT